MSELKQLLKDTLAQRMRLWETDAKPLIDAAGTRDLDASDQAKMANVEDALRGFDQRIGLLRGQIEAEESRAQVEAPGATSSSIAEQIRSVLVEKSASHIDLEFGAEQARALGTGTASDGAGNTIPATFWGEFVQPLRNFASVLQAGARVVVTASGEAITIPRLKTFGAAVKAIAPNTVIGGTDPTFEQVSWTTGKYGQVVSLPRELGEDSAIDIEALVADLIGQNIGLSLGGDLSTGLATAATAAVTGTVTGGVPSVDELIDLQHSVLQPYRPNAAWLANDTAIAGVRKLKDTTGQYIWQPSVQVGVPDLLLGKPIFGDAFLDAPGTGGKKPFLYGDISRFWVRMVNSLRLERSEHAAFTADQIVFKGTLRAGGVLTDANAVKAFQSKVA